MTPFRLQSRISRPKHLIWKAAICHNSTAASFAVVGTGRMGQIRVQDISSNPNAKLAYIVDTDLKKAQDLAHSFSSRAVDSIEQVLKDQSVDAVWVSTPTPTHFNLIKQIASAKKVIAVEKPVSSDLAEIDQAYVIAEQNQVPLFCSYQRRFDPSYMNLRAAVNSGELGPIRSILGIFRDHPVPPIEFLKQGGDLFHDVAVHDIDFICDLLGEYPAQVLASGSSSCPELKALSILDNASMFLQFPSGIVCMLDTSRGAAYGYDVRLEVFGDHGMLQVANQPATSTVTSSIHGIRHDVYSPSFPERFNEAYKHELQHVIDIVQHQVEPLVTHTAAKLTSIIAEGAKVSAESSRGVRFVRNPLDPTDISFEFC